MKSICTWADKNKDGKLTKQELDQADKRLAAMPLSAKQKEWFKKNELFPDNHRQAFGQYTDAARAAAVRKSYKDSLNEVFQINAIDSISRLDGNSKDISMNDWSDYTGSGWFMDKQG
jgi:lactam utilization protein B